MEEKRGLKTVTRRRGKGPRQIILDQHHQPRAFCAEETWKKSRRNFPSLPSLQPRSTPLKKINENSHLPSFVLNDITVSTAVISRTETILHLSLSRKNISRFVRLLLSPRSFRRPDTIRQPTACRLEGEARAQRHRVRSS